MDRLPFSASLSTVSRAKLPLVRDSRPSGSTPSRAKTIPRSRRSRVSKQETSPKITVTVRYGASKSARVLHVCWWFNCGGQESSLQATPNDFFQRALTERTVPDAAAGQN